MTGGASHGDSLWDDSGLAGKCLQKEEILLLAMLVGQTARWCKTIPGTGRG